MTHGILLGYPFYSASEIARYLHESSVWFRKSHGQNFLTDRNIIEKYAAAIADRCSDADVIEIGGGSGNLSLILAAYARSLTVVEIDRFFCRYLSALFSEELPFTHEPADNSGPSEREFSSVTLPPMNEELKKAIRGLSEKVGIVAGDFCALFPSRFIWPESDRRRKRVVFGNIPYNISTPIIERLAEAGEDIDEIILTVQKEYYERLVTEKDRSFITVFFMSQFRPVKCFSIHAASFVPKPKVDSVVFSAVPRTDGISPVERKSFFAFVSKAFSAKRKMMVNNFAGSDREKLEAAMTERHIDLSARAETLNADRFMELYESYRVLG